MTGKSSDKSPEMIVEFILAVISVILWLYKGQEIFTSLISSSLKNAILVLVAIILIIGLSVMGLMELREKIDKIKNGKENDKEEDDNDNDY